MSPTNDNDSFDELLDRFCIQELDEREWEAVAAHIASDPDCLRRYIEAVQWQQSMEYFGGDETATQSATVPRLVEPDSEVTHKSIRESKLPMDGGTRNRAGASLRERRRGFGSWAIAVSAAFAVGAAVTAIALKRVADPSGPAVAQTAQDAAPKALLPPAPFVQESRLGKVSGLSLEASSEGLLSPLQVGQSLRCGEVVQLTTGYIGVTLHSGPELIIEGPAEFSIIGSDSVFVRVGRIAANKAKKLLLQSPLLTAECNDAEVLFVAEEDTSTNVFAYKGVVTMRNIARRRAGNGKLAVLHEGNGLLVRPETTTDALTKLASGPPSGCVRSWAQVESGLSDAQRLVLSDRPVAYWPLHRVRRNRRVLDLTQHGFDGQAIGNWPAELTAAAKTEPGAYFNGECYIEPDRKPPIDLRSGFSVEGWAKVSGGPEFQAIFTSRWVLDAHAPHLQCLGFTLYAGKNDRWQFWTGSGHYGQFWQELHSDVELERHRWTHVVGTFDPEELGDGMPADTIQGTVRLYADGVLVGETKHEMSLLNFEWPARIGAAEFVPNSLTSWLFRGHLRDIALYDYPLEPARIRAHFEAGKSAS
jgi:Concanavalin A-like lectin/glucanases superfamily